MRFYIYFKSDPNGIVLPESSPTQMQIPPHHPKMLPTQTQDKSSMVGPHRNRIACTIIAHDTSTERFDICISKTERIWYISLDIKWEIIYIMYTQSSLKS